MSVGNCGLEADREPLESESAGRQTNTIVRFALLSWDFRDSNKRYRILPVFSFPLAITSSAICQATTCLLLHMYLKDLDSPKILRFHDGVFPTQFNVYYCS
ncbi:hypothetical protein JOB18_010251 [Solea senegalensis]|uniref:Uncharacterized protein n=1 Tax=Solea senegalensis TaxID=28829 RepID=A0AAV6RGF2_SOLSE|nr:hypothetical protein JOB18_010251 [Solea senegalensis]